MISSYNKWCYIKCLYDFKLDIFRFWTVNWTKQDILKFPFALHDTILWNKQQLIFKKLLALMKMKFCPKNVNRRRKDQQKKSL